MKIVVDTNILLDAIAERKPFDEDAKKIMQLIVEEKVEGFITANSITDIYYIARKALSDAKAREAIHHILNLFSIIDVSGKDCEAALSFPLNDYEDALIVICGKKVKADYILTRDENFLKSSDALNVILPRELFSKNEQI